MHRQHHDPQATPSGPSHADAFDWVYRFIAGHAACLVVFTRAGFGTQSFEMAGPMAVAVLFGYLLLAPCRDFILFAELWFAVMLLHRLLMLVRWMRGRYVHSRFDGYPWLVWAIVRPRPGYFAAKAVFEPLLILAVAALLYRFSVPLSLFCMIGAACVSVKCLLERSLEAAQIRAMKDQEIEMQLRVANFRGRR